MSCMIMKREPMAALANAVEARLNCGYDFWGFEAPKSLRRVLRDCRNGGCRYSAEAIRRRLCELNIRAYNGRYEGDEELSEIDEMPDTEMARYVIYHKPEYRKCGFAVCQWHYQLAMLLDFWLYQTAEDATCNDPLRLAMGEFRDGLYHFIVRNSPQYNVERWGELPLSES